MFREDQVMNVTPPGSATGGAARAVALLAALCVAIPRQLPAASIEVVSGDRQAATINEWFAEPIVVRALKDDGTPWPGVSITVFSDTCVSLEPEGCPPLAHYPLFDGGKDYASVVSNAEGIATTPRLRAGFGVGEHRIVAMTFEDTAARRSEIVLTQLDNQAMSIGAGFTGAWYTPGAGRHAVFLEVLPDNRVLAAWLTHDPQGNQAWFGGDGRIVDDVAIIEARRGQAGRWPSSDDPEAYHNEPWGTLAFSFSDCNHGRVHYTAYREGWGMGHVDLARLTLPAGLACDAP